MGTAKQKLRRHRVAQQAARTLSQQCSAKHESGLVCFNLEPESCRRAGHGAQALGNSDFLLWSEPNGALQRWTEEGEHVGLEPWTVGCFGSSRDTNTNAKPTDQPPLDAPPATSTSSSSGYVGTSSVIATNEQRAPSERDARDGLSASHDEPCDPARAPDDRSCSGQVLPGLSEPGVYPDNNRRLSGQHWNRVMSDTDGFDPAPSSPGHGGLSGHVTDHDEPAEHEPPLDLNLRGALPVVSIDKHWREPTVARISYGSIAFYEMRTDHEGACKVLARNNEGTFVVIGTYDHRQAHPFVGVCLCPEFPAHERSGVPFLDHWALFHHDHNNPTGEQLAAMALARHHLPNPPDDSTPPSSTSPVPPRR